MGWLCLPPIHENMHDQTYKAAKLLAEAFNKHPDDLKEAEKIYCQLPTNLLDYITDGELERE